MKVEIIKTPNGNDCEVNIRCKAYEAGVLQRTIGIMMMASHNETLRRFMNAFIEAEVLDE